jgi:hypothetical protein
MVIHDINERIDKTRNLFNKTPAVEAKKNTLRVSAIDWIEANILYTAVVSKI